MEFSLTMFPKLKLSAGEDPLANPTIYIILPVHNRRDITTAFCDCVEKQTYKNIFLILIDDGSTDGTAEAVAKYTFPKRIVQGNGSLWWAGGLRKGLARLAALHPTPEDIVLIMNDDTAFSPSFFELAVQELSTLQRPSLLAVPVVFLDSGKKAEGCFIADWPHFTFRDYGNHLERIDCASTRSLLFRYGDLQKIGTFRPRLLPHYLSDLEFTLRAHRRGVQILPARTVSCSATEYSSGVHGLQPGGFRNVLRQMLSLRFSANPIYLFIFILMAVPWKWKISSWLRITYSFLVFFISATVSNRFGKRKIV